MLDRTVAIRNKLGLHARAAVRFVNLSNRFSSSVKIVKDVGEAIRHIMKYGSYHSDAIVTRSRKNALRFLNEVDSACVFVNASTRFTDGGQFGKGAEMGISTDKIHARGPMGLEELTSYKYTIVGNGQVRK